MEQFTLFINRFNDHTSKAWFNLALDFREDFVFKLCWFFFRYQNQPNLHIPHQNQQDYIFHRKIWYYNLTCLMEAVNNVKKRLLFVWDFSMGIFSNCSFWSLFQKMGKAWSIITVHPWWKLISQEHAIRIVFTLTQLPEARNK